MSAHTPQELQAVAATATATPNEVLTLRLGAEEYGIDILRVQEIRSYEPPTRIAGAPPHVLGVTNLRRHRASRRPQLLLRTGRYPVFGPLFISSAARRRSVLPLKELALGAAWLMPPRSPR